MSAITHSGSAQLPFTRWSLLIDAQQGDATTKRRALNEFCRLYWMPFYAFLRRRGHAPQDAEDLTQSFFARLLSQNRLGHIDSSRGRLRSYLLTALGNFAVNDWSKQKAVKRGGDDVTLSLDADNAEVAYLAEPADHITPEHLFEKRWAMALLDHSLKRLREEYEAAGKGALFAALKPMLVMAGEKISFQEIATATGMSEGGARVAAHRLRQHLRVILEEEVALTVEDPADVADEIKYLMSVMAGTG